MYESELAILIKLHFKCRSVLIFFFSAELHSSIVRDWFFFHRWNWPNCVVFHSYAWQTGTSITFLLMSFRRLSKLSWLCVFLNCAKAKKDSRDSLNLTSFLIQLALLTASAMVIWTPVRLLLGLLINCLFLQMSTSVSNSALAKEFRLSICKTHWRNCAQKIRNERQFSESDCIVQWNFTKDTLQPKVENGALLQWKQTIETRVKAEQQHPLMMIWLQHFL